MNIFSKPLSLALIFLLGALSPLCSEEEIEEPKALREPESRVESLVLVDEGTSSVLSLLEKLTGKSVLRKQNLPPVKISFDSHGSLSKDEAILAIESLLSMNGIAVIETGNFLKAVPSANVSSEAPTVLTQPALSLPPSEKIYAELFRLNFLSTEAAAKQILPLLTPNVSSVLHLENSSALLITDTLANLQRIESLFSRTDQPLSSNEEVFFYKIKHTSAIEMRDRLREMQKDSMKKYLSENITFDADEGTNQLMVLANPQQKANIDRFIKSLDVDIQPLTTSQVFRIMHANAKDVSDLIKAVVKGQELPEKDKSNDAKMTALERLREAIAKRAGETPAKKESESSAAQKFSRDVTVEADERSNAIVAYGSPKDLEQIRSLIEKLDVLLAQVRIEVVIAQVTLTKDQVSGLSSFGIGYNGFGLDNSKGIGGTIPGATPPLSEISLGATTPTSDNLKSSSNIAASIKNFSIGTVFNVAKQDQNVRILSAPTILTTHNREATISVGEKRPLVKSSTVDQTTSNITRTAFEYQDIALLLKVKPLIGHDGVIQMEIEQLIEKFSGNVTIDKQDQPIISKREAKSFISVADQEIVILAGLQETDMSDKKGKLWLLGDIPIVGDILFSPKNKTHVTRELVIFIKPYILNNTTETNHHALDYMDTQTSKDEIKTYFDTGYFDSMEAPKTQAKCEGKVRHHKR